jgi:hypothetical protein
LLGFVLLAAPTPQPVPTVVLSYSEYPLMGFAARQHNCLRLEAARRINEWPKPDPDLSLNVSSFSSPKISSERSLISCDECPLSVG